MRWLFVSLVVAVVGCTDGDDADGTKDEEGCDSCEDGQACLVHNGETDEDDYESCVDAPAECGGTVSCGDTACVGALYGECDDGFIGQACSDTLDPALITCNLDSPS